MDQPLSWSDIYFMSIKKRNFFNCCIVTVYDDMEEIAENIAWEESQKLLNFEDWTIEKSKDPEYTKSETEIFGGISRYKWIQNRTQKILPTMKSNERYKIMKGYNCGIGLEMIVNELELNKEIIEKHILKFRELGECNYFSREMIKYNPNCVISKANALCKIEK
jgi:hypothetical protein